MKNFYPFIYAVVGSLLFIAGVLIGVNIENANWEEKSISWGIVKRHPVYGKLVYQRPRCEESEMEAKEKGE